MKAFVTGAGGFAGTHLVRHLSAGGHEVVATDLVAPPSTVEGVQCLPLDVTDEQACWNLLTDCKPDRVFHLAGMAHVMHAEADAARCFEVNAGGCRNMLEACLDGHARVRFLFVSSAEAYGRVSVADLPVGEDHPLRPATAYAASKACGEMHVSHAVARGLHAVVARAFNHIGPHQSDDFVTAAFAHQIARIEAGLQDPVLQVGNLAAVRDFSDVRDTVAAYESCLEHGLPGEVFNVTSGWAVSIQEILDGLVSLSPGEILVEQDPARLRPIDVPVFQGSAERLRERTGHRPAYDLKQALAGVLDYWRATVASEGRVPER
jgi:GDP-4-dehydro-6-deoxy-D-mannose reductase